VQIEGGDDVALGEHLRDVSAGRGRQLLERALDLQQHALAALCDQARHELAR
jgi:hypothetical protein